MSEPVKKPAPKKEAPAPAPEEVVEDVAEDVAEEVAEEAEEETPPPAKKPRKISLADAVEKLNGSVDGLRADMKGMLHGGRDSGAEDPGNPAGNRGAGKEKGSVQAPGFRIRWPWELGDDD